MMGKEMESVYNQSFNLNNSNENMPFYDYAFVPYNKKWGSSQILVSVPVMISLEQKCIVNFTETVEALKKVIYSRLNQMPCSTKKTSYMSFDIKYSEIHGCYVIDQDSFRPYYGEIEQLHQLPTSDVSLETPVFISPNGQPWIDEMKYKEYAETNKYVIYECSDGSLTKSYEDFKTWEKELALRPNNPNFSVLPYGTTLEDIDHYEVASDGTIWRNATILQEYLAWRKDHNHNYKDGYYCGHYGMANSFREYAQRFNASYFIVKDLRREEQYLDPTYSFLFSSQAAADEYVKRLKSFQKKI